MNPPEEEATTQQDPPPLPPASPLIGAPQISHTQKCFEDSGCEISVLFLASCGLVDENGSPLMDASDEVWTKGGGERVNPRCHRGGGFGSKLILTNSSGPTLAHVTMSVNSFWRSRISPFQEPELVRLLRNSDHGESVHFYKQLRSDPSQN